MQGANKNVKRYEMNYLQGVNRQTAPDLMKKGELYHSENVRSLVVGTLETRDGSSVIGNDISAIANLGIFPFQIGTGKGLYRLSTVSATTSIFYLNGSNVWTILSGEGTSITSGSMSQTIADGNCYIANYNDANRMISGADGVTVYDSSSASSNLYNCPDASKICYFKGCLYVGDFKISSTRYGNRILKSSPPLGLVALINATPVAPYTTLGVDEATYIYTVSGMNVLDIYRNGDSKVAEFTITSMTDTDITGTISFTAPYTDVQEGDQLWVHGTFGGTQVFRWPKTPSLAGTNVNTYGTWTLPSRDGSNLTVLDTLGNKLIVGNKTALSAIDDFTSKNFSTDVGCVSPRGYVSLFGVMYYVSYDGIYRTDGASSEKISTKIQKYFDNATKAGLEVSCAGKKGNSVFFYIGNTSLVREDGSVEKTLSNVTIEFNVAYSMFFVHTGLAFLQFLSYTDTTGIDRLIGITATKAYEFLAPEITTDDGAIIPIRFDVIQPPLSSRFDHPSLYHEIDVETLRGVGTKCLISQDFSDWTPVEKEIGKGLTIVKLNGVDDSHSTPPKCRRLGISFRRSLAQKMKMTGFCTYYTPTYDEDRSNSQA